MNSLKSASMLQYRNRVLPHAAAVIHDAYGCTVNQLQYRNRVLPHAAPQPAFRSAPPAGVSIPQQGYPLCGLIEVVKTWLDK